MQISGRQAQRMGQQGLVTHMCGFLYGVLKNGLELGGVLGTQSPRIS